MFCTKPDYPPLVPFNGMSRPMPTSFCTQYTLASCSNRDRLSFYAEIQISGESLCQYEYVQYSRYLIIIAQKTDDRNITTQHSFAHSF